MTLISISEDYQQYLFEYRFGDSVWGIQIAAKDADEARERLKAISWAQYKGEIVATIPVPGAGLLKRITALLSILSRDVDHSADRG
ncbi:MAG: hypothetical protein K8F62_12285 [Pseudorhodoplanes sp.]|nr:hypothetical protein [Pseudorhodoplanes sp.]